jgi:hypothetical protein
MRHAVVKKANSYQFMKKARTFFVLASLFAADAASAGVTVANLTAQQQEGTKNVVIS